MRLSNVTPSGISPSDATKPSGAPTSATVVPPGRVVIPAALRDRAGLTPGATLVVSLDDDGIRLTRSAPPPRLVRVGRRLVAKPTAREGAPVIDIAQIVEDERNRWP